MRPHSKAGHLRQVQPHRSPSIGTGVQARRRAKLAVLAARTELRRGNRSMCSRMSGCSFSRQRMFETRTGATPVCLAMAAPLRNSPLSMRACHSRASAKRRTIFGSSGGLAGGGSARFAGFETTRRKVLLPSPLARRTPLLAIRRGSARLHCNDKPLLIHRCGCALATHVRPRASGARSAFGSSRGSNPLGRARFSILRARSLRPVSDLSFVGGGPW